MSRRKAIRAVWFCQGCGREHPLSRDIEGDAGGGRYWCRHSMALAIRTRRNDTPPAHQMRGIWRASPSLQKGFPSP